MKMGGHRRLINKQLTNYNTILSIADWRITKMHIHEKSCFICDFDEFQAQKEMFKLVDRALMKN